MEISQVDLTTDLLDEVTPLLEKNKEEGCPIDSKLSFDKDIYIYLNLAEAYSAFIVREERGKIIGYVGYFISQDPHNNAYMQAVQDVLYVDSDYRKSFVGLKLLKYSEEKLKNDGVNYIYQQSLSSIPIDPLFKRLGYKEVSKVFIKEI